MSKKPIPAFVTTMEDILNSECVMPRTDTVDVYVLVDDLDTMRINGFAVYDGDNWRLCNSFKELLDEELNYAE